LSPKLVRIAVSESFRGLSATEKEVTISTGNGMGDCGYAFVVGLDYIIYGRPLTSGTYETDICTRTRPAEMAADDVAYLRGQFRSPGSSGQILGRIERWDPDSNTGGAADPSPLSDVRIVARGNGREYSTVSGNDGRFDVSVPVGKYEIQSQLSGPVYATTLPNVVEVLDVRGCGSVAITVRSDGRVRGRVVDALGKAVPAFAVEVVRTRWFGQSEAINGRTAADGTFEIERIPPGQYFLGANTVRGLDSSRTWRLQVLLYPGITQVGKAQVIEIRAGQRVTLDSEFVLPSEIRLALIAGVVKDAQGQPVRGAAVTLRRSDSRRVGDPAITDSDGVFTFTAIEGASYRIMAEQTRMPTTTARSPVHSPEEIIVPSRDAGPLTLTIR
jgi:protocatechuate 3,4-dioxygenase beta subunit